MEDLMHRVAVDGVEMEYEVRGKGEPVLLIHLSVVAEGLARPLFGQPELAGRYQLIHYHRRGYGGSTRGSAPLTAAREAADAAALLGHLGLERAHVVGHSYGGMVALQLAVDCPRLVHSLALLEPAMPMGPEGSARLEQLFTPMTQAYGHGDRRQAMLALSDAIFGPGWQPIVEKTVPGAVEQAVKDFDTFILEQGPIRDWRFGPDQAAPLRQPVLSVVGVNTSPFMKAGRTQLHSLLPQTVDLDIQSTHLLQMKEPAAVAEGLAEFLSRHPIRIA